MNKKILNLNLENLFKSDPNRAQKYAIQLDQIYCDYSKNHIDENILKDLINWADKSNLEKKSKNF